MKGFTDLRDYGIRVVQGPNHWQLGPFPSSEWPRSVWLDTTVVGKNLMGFFIIDIGRDRALKIRCEFCGSVVQSMPPGEAAVKLDYYAELAEDHWARYHYEGPLSTIKWRYTS